MSNYIRSSSPGGTFFFTAKLQDRSSDLLVREIDRLRQATRDVRTHHPFTIDAIVVLPAKIHTIWTLPEGDADFSGRWSLLKRLFSKGLPAPEHRTRSQIRRGEKGIWQRRFWEHRIRNASDLETHRHLIHSAPLHEGLVVRPQDWSWTSLHRELAERHREANPQRPS